MKHILYITSSLFGDQSASKQLSDNFVHGLKKRYPGSVVTVLDLAREPLPHLDADEFTAWTIAEEDRTEAQARSASRSDRLVDQLLAHDTLVLAVPMYNLGIPSTLKAWIDRVSRAGKTFRYTAHGAQGLVENIKVYLFFARGGRYRDTPLDTQTGYLKSVLGLMGITDVETVYAEGLNMGDETRTGSLGDAELTIRHLLTEMPAEVKHAAA